MQLLELSFESGLDSLSVRKVSTSEGVSRLFEIEVWARSPDPQIDLEAIVGHGVELQAVTGWNVALPGGTRRWSGIVSHIEQAQAEPTGLSTYFLRIVPRLWLLTQRTNHRIYQHISIPDIIDKLLAEWQMEPAWQIDRGKYPKLEYKVQYGESDFQFFARLLEEAGIAFTFPFDAGVGSRLTLGDELHGAAARGAPAIPFVDNPSHTTGTEKEHVTKVRLSHGVKPGAHTLRDYDFRNPAYELFGKSEKAAAPEDFYEQYHYAPGEMLVETGKKGEMAVADAKGTARSDQVFGRDRATQRLWADRFEKRAVDLLSNVIDLWPGAVFTIGQHPHEELHEGQRLLVTEQRFVATPEGEWSMETRAVFAADPFRPPMKTAKPVVSGVQSATVVGPAGQEIFPDELGRVRVQFPWDREGTMDDDSSCWIRVSQGWAGTGFGLLTIPRIGQEVLVGFLEGDPDLPIIVGRVFNQKNPVPYRLPEHKTRSTWKSDSSLGGGGFNEIMFEDLKGKELFWVQAEKNLRKLVKNDETITIGNNRMKLVVANETETTHLNRTEVTSIDRTELTHRNRTTVIGQNRTKLVKANEIERVEGNQTAFVGQNQDIVVRENKREYVGGNAHSHVKGNLSEKVGQSHSLTVLGDHQEKVGQNHAIEAGREIHLMSRRNFVIECETDLTIKGPGGFIRLDSGGITISGTLVNINSGGSPGSGGGSSPAAPEQAKEAQVTPPPDPEMDDIRKTGIAQ
ncbi:MAG: type VI secretion system tip protein TssI/VgrG [Polyangiaceae bacterium]